jgi:cytochrome c oxidase subunit 2
MKLRTLPRRRVIAAMAGCAAAGWLAGLELAAAENRITLAVMKFEFSKREIRARKGERVTLVLTASDFVHGFSVPDFNVRADVPPGKPVDVTFIPDRTGRFVFLCDNFCGEGHDRMSGVLVVTD